MNEMNELRNERKLGGKSKQQKEKGVEGIQKKNRKVCRGKGGEKEVYV